MAPTDWYDAHAPELAATYESIAAQRVHAWLGHLLPAEGGVAMDVGAGTGRDAAWLASRGLQVVAVEPSNAMREQALALHPGANVRWIADALPDLRRVLRLGLSFDLILLSAVWMHVPPSERARAFRKLVALLRPGGLLAITLRVGIPDSSRAMYEVSESEIAKLAASHGAFVETRAEAPDALGRPDVAWVQLAIRLPDDGTGALPLLRHAILDDDKSSTYKLALVCVLGRIADGAAGTPRFTADDRVRVPLGLVGLYWIRLFRPLLAADLPQSPENRGLERLGFVKEGFRRLQGVSHLDLRMGQGFAGDRAQALHSALRDACRTIAIMPAHYLTYPGSDESVFPARHVNPGRAPATIVIDEAYLASFGELLVPLHLWTALQRFGAWIEPAVIAEWIRLMHRYAETQERTLSDHRIAVAMTWADPARDVRVARDRALRAMGTAPLHCVWSGRRLTERGLDIDHCLPWAAWPCDHLWNLMPAHRDVNRQKRDRLPGDELLRVAHDRILDWWDRSYARANAPIARRFHAEARSGLPAMPDGEFGLDDVFAGLAVQRLRLRRDQGIAEWAGPTARTLLVSTR